MKNLTWCLLLFAALGVIALAVAMERVGQRISTEADGGIEAPSLFKGAQHPVPQKYPRSWEREIHQLDVLLSQGDCEAYMAAFEHMWSSVSTVDTLKGRTRVDCHLQRARTIEARCKQGCSDAERREVGEIRQYVESQRP